MKRITSAIMILYFINPEAISQHKIFPIPLSPRIANYNISVTLDAQKKMLQGKETLIWKNVTRDRIRELQFHLYLNAFKDRESTFMKESHRTYDDSEENKWGWIRIKAMSIRGGENLTDKIEFIHPDDDNLQDHTVIRVPLKKPIKKRKTVTVDIEFEAQLPTIFSRTGYYKDFYMIAQWFPKIGVYEAADRVNSKKGTWNCHQFHSNTEFYADYGVYDVDITVPQNYTVGAVGILEEEQKNKDSTKTLKFHAEDVHDFSWTASPDFTVVEDRWNNVKIRLLTQPYKVGNISDRHIQSAKVALRYFHDLIGEYPYPNLTIVDPPLKAINASGMEYPTLITTMSIWGVPDNIKLDELVTIHEFGHQYWYGMVGNNEFEEAWLDEGITQYYETRIMDAEYGQKTSFADCFGIQVGDFQMARSDYISGNPKLAPILQPAWKYNAGGYAKFTYAKSTTMLTTFERMVGRNIMDTIMQTFFERWKFKHPTTKDFMNIVNDIVPAKLGLKYGKNLDWYFDQILSGTDICDYELTRISIFDVDTSKEKREEVKRKFNSRVLVSRLGEMKVPVEILMKFDDGKEIREKWDGQARFKLFEYSDSSKVISAIVDPENILAIDINNNNNSKTLEPSSLPFWKYTIQFMTFVQSILQSVVLF
jgi:hypothetical protein